MRLSAELIITIILTFGGTLFSAIAYKEWKSTTHIIKEGKQTKGVVIELVRRPRRTGEQFQSTSMAPVVLFYTEKGQQKYYCQTYTTPAQYAIGDQVDILYMPDEPNKATLKGLDSWILPAAFGIFGSVMALIGYSLLINLLIRYIKLRIQTA